MAGAALGPVGRIARRRFLEFVAASPLWAAASPFSAQTLYGGGTPQ